MKNLKAVFFALSAVFLYAGQNVYLEHKLTSYQPSALLMLFYLIMLPLAVFQTFFMGNNGIGAIPSGVMIIPVLLCGLAYYLADFCFVSAYTSGGDLLTISTIIALFPAAASIIKYLTVSRELPDGWLWLCLCGCYLSDH